MKGFQFLQKIISVFLIIGWTRTSYADKEVGDQCEVARSGSAGTCKIIADCPKVLEEYAEGLDPALCGTTVDHKPVVCCPIPPTQRTTTQAPSLTRISQKSNEFKSID